MGARFSAPVQTGPGPQPVSTKMGTGSFPAVNSGRGVTLTPHPLLVPWSRNSRAIPLLPLWNVRPVQSFSASIKVHFTFTLYDVQKRQGLLTKCFFPSGLCCRELKCFLYFRVSCVTIIQRYERTEVVGVKLTPMSLRPTEIPYRVLERTRASALSELNIKAEFEVLCAGKS